MVASAQTRQNLARLMEFVLLKNGKYDTSWVFYMPPESMEQEEPVKQQTVRTQAGGYADLFGPDFPPITLEGTTGYGMRAFKNGAEVDGYTYWLQFLKEIYRIFVESPNSNAEYGLHFYNWTHQQYYDVIPISVTWDMAVPENIVFYYHIELTGLQPLLQPHSAPYSTSYDHIIINNTTNFRNVAMDGAKHSAMAQVLLGMGAGDARLMEI